MIILPDLLERDVGEFNEKLLWVGKGGVDRIHVDVIERAFANNVTLFPRDWPTGLDGLNIDVHLMVEEPESWVDECVKAGVNAVIAHVEKMKDVSGFVEGVKGKGLKVGVAIDLPTSVEMIDWKRFRDVDQVLLLSVKAGWSGQMFDQSVLVKIKAVREKVGNHAEIIVDGGINFDNAKLCRDAGADGVAVNSWLWVDFENRWRKMGNLE